MQESQILTGPEKEAKKAESFTQIQYVIKENEIITNEKENICTPPGTKQNSQSKQRARKSFEINNVLKKVEESQGYKILFPALKSLTEACKDSTINTNVETIFEGKVCEAVVKYLKKLKLEYKFSFLNKPLQEILDDELLEDENFLRWLAKQLDMPFTKLPVLLNEEYRWDCLFQEIVDIFHLLFKFTNFFCILCSFLNLLYKLFLPKKF